MRWERLLADVEAQGEQEARAEREAEVRERVRIEQAQVPAMERLAAQSNPICVYLRDGRRCRGVLREVGEGWISLDGHVDNREGTSHALLTTAAICQVEGMRPGRGALGMADRLGLGHPLRALAERSQVVVIETLNGPAREGRLSWVGKDFIEIIAAQPRRHQECEVVLVPFSAIASVVT